MYRIGEFSILSKTTIKTLRYYEKENLLITSHIDKETGYRYYETSQLIDLSKIISLRQIGMSIKDIKKVQEGYDIKELLEIRKKDIENNLNLEHIQLSKINYLLEEKDMKEEIFEKIVPAYYVYYKEGLLKDYSEASEFIISSGQECMELNPNIKCIEPDYCYVNYLDGEYKEKNIKVRYAQAVIKENQPFKENNNIKFMDIPETKCICIYHKGSYETLGKSYAKIMKYIEDNKLEIKEYPRECYIDGIWNKDNVEDWLTEIQIPIK